MKTKGCLKGCLIYHVFALLLLLSAYGIKNSDRGGYYTSCLPKGANVYSTPDLNGDILMNIPQGEHVQVSKIIPSEWAIIDKDSTLLYIPLESLLLIKSDPIYEGPIEANEECAFAFMIFFVISNLISFVLCCLLHKMEYSGKYLNISYCFILTISFIELFYFIGVMNSYDLLLGVIPFPVRHGWFLFVVSAITFIITMGAQTVLFLMVSVGNKRKFNKWHISRIALLVIGIPALISVLIVGLVMLYGIAIVFTIAILAFLFLSYTVAGMQLLASIKSISTKNECGDSNTTIRNYGCDCFKYEEGGHGRGYCKQQGCECKYRNIDASGCYYYLRR